MDILVVMKPTYEELKAKNAALEAENALLKREVAELRTLIEQLLARIADLESQLNKNSKNSSKPPSSDQKPNTLPAKEKKKRRFRTGVSRQLLPESEVTSHEKKAIDTCPKCCSTMKTTGKVVKWQQIELPKIEPLVHQWELHESCCPNCKWIAMPELQKEETYLLGPRLEAFINLCLGRFRMGHRMIREFVATLLPKVDLSQGLISKIKRRSAKALASPHQEIMEKILAGNHPIHVDATGWRHMNMNQHAVVMKAHNWVAFTFIKHQNTSTFKELLAGKDLHLVTDRGLPTGQVKTKSHQYCLAHLLRNIQGLAEHSQTTQAETGQLGEIYDTLQQLFVDKHRMDKGEIRINTWRQYGYQLWQNIEECIGELLASHPGKKVSRFFRKMQNGWRYFKTYLRRPDYPMTNNPAEEALRSLVIARKLCFGSRSAYGKNWRAAIQSCVETLRRNGLSILDFVTDAIRTYRCDSPSPNICPL